MAPHYGQVAHRVKRGQLPLGKKSGAWNYKSMPKLKTDTPGSLPDRLSVGQRLTAMREALGLEKAALADEIRCDRSTWGKFESGERSLTLGVAWRLYQLYGFSLDYIFDGKRHGIPATYTDSVLSSLAALHGTLQPQQLPAVTPRKA